MPRKITDNLKRLVSARANYCCEYCLTQLKFSSAPFSCDHIMPVAKGGNDEFDNLGYSCQGCNNKKRDHIGGRDPVTGKLETLFNPRNDNWEEHFRWNDDFSILIGLTPIGRASIDRLDLNRIGLTNLRKALRNFNAHPPF